VGAGLARTLLSESGMSNANMRRTRASWLIGAAFAAVVGRAPAAHAEESAAAPSNGETSWYGWQTMASDGTAIALWATAAYLDDAKYTSGSFQTYKTLSNVAVVAGLGIYALGAPLVHARRGHTDKFAGSLLVRLAMPAAGLLAGWLGAAATCGPDIEDEVPCPVVGAVLGTAAGGLAAMIVDAAFIAREPVASDGGSSVQPLIMPTNGGAAFSLAGRF